MPAKQRALGRFPLLAGILSLIFLSNCQQATKVAPPPSLLGPNAPTTRRAEFVLTPQSRVDLHGTSNFGDWNTRSASLGAQVVLDTEPSEIVALFDKLQNGPVSPADLRLSLGSPPLAQLWVPVISLRGDHPGMDPEMFWALKGQDNPNIRYIFRSVESAEAITEPSTGHRGLLLHIVGTLSIAGVGHDMVSDLTIRRDERGHFLVHTEANVLMTDFGVPPPVVFFNLIHCADGVSVKFNLDFVPA